MQIALDSVKLSELDSEFNNFDTVYQDLFSFLEEDPRLDQATEDFTVVTTADSVDETSFWFIKRLLNSKLEADWSTWRVRDIQYCEESKTLNYKIGMISFEEGNSVH
jgi:hypothetical protein